MCTRVYICPKGYVFQHPLYCTILEPPKCPNPDQLSKLWYVPHNGMLYSWEEMCKKGLYQPIWSDYQEILLRWKKQSTKQHINIVCYPLSEKEGGKILKYAQMRFSLQKRSRKKPAEHSEAATHTGWGWGGRKRGVAAGRGGVA